MLDVGEHDHGVGGVGGGRLVAGVGVAPGRPREDLLQEPGAKVILKLTYLRSLTLQFNSNETSQELFLRQWK